jgi:hypothetical protein
MDDSFTREYSGSFRVMGLMLIIIGEDREERE